MAADRGAARRRNLITRFEPWFLLPAGVPLVFPEVTSPWAQIAAVTWVVALWANRRRSLGRWSHATPLDVPIIALLITLPGAMAVATDTQAAVSRAESLLFAVALYYALANSIRTPRHLWSAVTWLLVAGMSVASLGLVLATWPHKYPILAAITDPLPRLSATVPHPTLRGGVQANELAGVLIMFVPMALALLLWRRGSGDGDATLEAPLMLRPVAALSLVVVMPVLLLTQSRGAWLALAATVVTMAVARVAWRRRPGGPIALLVGLAVASLVVVAVPMAAYTVWGTTSSEARPEGVARIGERMVRWFVGTAPGAHVDAPRTGRVALWRDVLEMIAQHPAAGVGLNNFPLEFGQRPEYEGFFVYAGIPHAHNVYLQAAIDYGVPGFAAVVGLAAALAWAAWRTARRLWTTPLVPTVVGLAFGVMAYGLHGLVDAVAVGAKPGFLVWALAGTLVGARRGAHTWSMVTRGGVTPATAAQAPPSAASRRLARPLSGGSRAPASRALLVWAGASGAGLVAAAVIGGPRALVAAGIGGA
ncbi:MAG: O-antigen ligase family protein, partial [Anaerolineae bacterium]